MTPEINRRIFGKVLASVVFLPRIKDTDAISSQFTKRLVSLARVVMERNESNISCKRIFFATKHWKDWKDTNIIRINK